MYYTEKKPPGIFGGENPMSHLSSMKNPGLAISARSQRLRSDLRWKIWNLNAKMQNSKVQHATRALVVRRSLEQGPNP